MEFPSSFAIHVKPNKKETRIIKFDRVANVIVLEVAGAPVDGEANAEIVRFFKKEFGLRVEIISGLTSKKKIVRVINP